MNLTGIYNIDVLHGLFVTPENCAFGTDLYQLTMAAAYWTEKINDTATFELYFRRLPAHRSYVVAAGLEQALDYILNVRFTNDQLTWLRNLPQFRSIDESFFDALRKFRFSGDVYAVPEGTVIFPLEPIVQVRAPLMEAQLMETYLLSVINMQSLIATKAARIVHAANGRAVVDFGTRRAHGPQAGLYAARASFIGGCVGTSNVLASYLAGIPTYGTTAHSFTMAFSTELEAFHAYNQVFPENTVLLIDTYDTIAAAKKVKQIPNVKAVRIDSGNLLELSIQIRKILDEDGLTNVQIFASGDLNEYKIHELLKDGAPIDFFGVGTELVTSYDDPALSGVYKIVEATLAGHLEPRVKISPGKTSYPGKKQIYRVKKGSRFSHDMLCLFDEKTEGTPLLQCYVREGCLVGKIPDLMEAQQYSMQQLDALRSEFHELESVATYRVILSDELKKELDRVSASLR